MHNISLFTSAGSLELCFVHKALAKLRIEISLCNYYLLITFIIDIFIFMLKYSGSISSFFWQIGPSLFWNN